MYKPGYVIMLSVGRLWKPLGANSESIFPSAEAAREQMARFSGRGALANARVMRIAGRDATGAHWHDGWWLVEEETTAA